MARAKICGLARDADVRAAIEAGADAVGVVSEVPVETPREVDPATAADLLADVPPFVTGTLVTMPDSPERAVELAGLVGPDALQLHGEWTPEEVAYVRAETGTKVLLTVDADEHERAERLAEAADALVVDSTTEEGAGGTGRTHDWEATGDLAARLTTPVVLAGGLTPDNVAEAVEVADPFAVDVASGVELEGGRKDHNALARFVRNAGREVTLA